MMDITNFLTNIWEYYRAHRRDLEWRHTSNPYHILVSEMMLQQTQVSRVMSAYHSFIIAFPDWKSLADAPMVTVLSVWKGLGYNRWAYFLKSIAEEITYVRHGVFPHTYDEQLKLPGIGQSTAGALQAFAYGSAYPFIETNIRTVIIHAFFSDIDRKVTDKQITEKLESILAHVPEAEVKDFYYALYDYGAMLKQSLGKHATSLHRRSTTYKKQSTFRGSKRQLRASILHYIAERQRCKQKHTQKDMQQHAQSRTQEHASTYAQEQFPLHHATLHDMPETSSALTRDAIVSYIQDQIASGIIPYTTDDVTEALTAILEDLCKKKQLQKITTGNSVLYHI